MSSLPSGKRQEYETYIINCCCSGFCFGDTKDLWSNNTNFLACYLLGLSWSILYSIWA